ncbi:MAG: alpha-1,4-glucan--maltose-1-phosphate maltosyltransferase [Actinomycetales bacterium]|nr:alpha-1,4-glucan--maltose-1-phosphate maltosyltransferase [Actinomycetales bacterium]
MGRLPILNITPTVEGGRWPAKAIVGEVIPFSAVVFREGHDALGVELLLTDPNGKQTVHRMHPGAPGSDRWHVTAQLSTQGHHKFTIRAFSDEFETWHHNAEVKLAVGVDEELLMLEGIRVLTRAAAEKGRTKANAKHLVELAEVLEDTSRSAQARFEAANTDTVKKAVADQPIRDLITLSDEFVINCERQYAGAAAWYEFFPRSEGAKFDAKTKTWTSGNFKTAAKRLPAVAAMGFDVLYMPPIHPIGHAHRKGPNNTLTVGPQDPGSPWAIGSADGGHDAIHPDLGTEKDFKAFVKKANDLGLEIALDLALQASPDHPWVAEHPEWFTTRADGTIAYAENPPKKYQDIYPINFDNDRDGIYNEVLRVVKHWISLGVKIFRVDNPHTKPVNFWEWLINEINAEFPDIVFLAEAFTRPAMMHALGKVGFQQSYTYYTWRNTKDELQSYLTELAYDSADFFRPNLWVSTPDILTQFLQYGGPAGHKLRATIAATASPSWGMYAGYELVESVARPGAEEHIDSEKYEFKPRDWAAAEKSGRSIAPHITKLNEIRKAHPALMQLRNIEFHHTDDSSILAFSKHLAAEHSPTGKADTVIVVVNVDPHSVRETGVHLDLAKLGLPYGSQFEVHDLITGEKWIWSADNYVRLDSFVESAHVLHVTKIVKG